MCSQLCMLIGWPSVDDVQTAVGSSMGECDISPYNKKPNGGFRGYMEGFEVVDRCDSSIRGKIFVWMGFKGYFTTL